MRDLSIVGQIRNSNGDQKIGDLLVPLVSLRRVALRHSRRAYPACTERCRGELSRTVAANHPAIGNHLRSFKQTV